MFKLLKELTKAPEPLAGPSSHGSNSPGSQQGVGTFASDGSTLASHFIQHHQYVPRQPRSHSPAGGAGGRSRSNTVEKKDVPPAVVPETDPDGLEVVRLLKVLEEGTVDDDNRLMSIVELLSIKSHTKSRGAFRRNKGFQTLLKTLRTGLAWRPKGPDTSEEIAQVGEVQRLEGVRLGFEVLAWATSDRESLLYFEREIRWIALLPLLYRLSPQTSGSPSSPTISVQDPSSSFSEVIDTSSPSTHQQPDSHILAILLSNIFCDNYSLLSIVKDISPETLALNTEDLSSKLGDLSIRHGGALQLLWAYLWGYPEESLSKASYKGKEKALHTLEDTIWAGHYEGETDDTGSQDNQARLVQVTFQILLASATYSAANLFAIKTRLPRLASFLITRLFGIQGKREFLSPYPRDDWVEKEEDDDLEVPVWREPSAALRKIYLALLKKLLEAGVDQEVTWSLFSLVRIENRPNIKPPLFKDWAIGDAPPVVQDGSSETSNTATTNGKSRRPPKLDIPAALTAPPEMLHSEVVELIKHGMKSRWPQAFVFRSLKGEVEGGIELQDMGRPWPNSSKGFSFSCWIYITKLEQPLVLFEASQARSKHPLVQIRILENSQIAYSASTYTETPATPSPPPEFICSAPDALIPHFQWVHFGFGCRKASDGAEARIYVNGVRVGHMKVIYPVPAPPAAATTAPQLGVKAGVSADAIRLSLGRSQCVAETSDCKASAGTADGNDWMLGRVLLLEEFLHDDLVLLQHHLGPRYSGSMQEPLGKFLTYEAATSINIFLHAQALAAGDKRIFSQPNKPILVKAIRVGPAIAEDSVLLSLTANDCFRGANNKDHCVNAAIPHPHRARQLRHGFVDLVGSVQAFSTTYLDDSVAAVGGGIVVLKMIDMACSGDELAACLAILRDMLKDSWAASEEMERIRGFELLAAILRPKMPNLMNVQCAKTLLAILGIKVDKPNHATVHNSVAYRAIGLDFELWSYAPVPVLTIYLQHFELLLSSSNHKRYNVLRTFQKSQIVKKLLYAIRSGFFDSQVLPMVVDTLKLALLSRWGGEDAIKPVFSYLVSALCQGTAGFMTPSYTDPPPSQAAAAQVLAMIADICHDQQRLVKLNRTIALHRLLVIFISSNAANYVISPCLDILEQCVTTPGLESFERSFESEGGFALLARTLAASWRSDIQSTIFRILLDSENEGSALRCSPLMATLFAALDYLLQNPNEGESGNSAPSTPKLRSASIMSLSMSPATPMTPFGAADASSDDDRLQKLLRQLTVTYHASSPFRRGISSKKVEAMLPAMADFAAVSSSGPDTESISNQRSAAADWLAALIGRSSSRLPNSIITQMKLLVEHLRSPIISSKISSSTFSPTSPSSPRPSTSYFGRESFSSRLGSSPAYAGGTSIRRRPSTEAGIGLARKRSIPDRMPLRRVLTGESILEGGKDKNAAWKLIIIQTDAQAHGKMTLERKEYVTNLSNEDWPRAVALLWTENGLWPDRDTPVTWRLDGSEGPLRMRNRLERVNAYPEEGMTRTKHKLRDAIPSVGELSSAVSRINLAPWEDPFALALGEAATIAEEEPAPTLAPPLGAPERAATPDNTTLDDDSFVEVDGNKDDKMSRIAKTLEAGDVVEEAHNIVRIVGVDACPGLLILGKKNLYLIDGLVQSAGGEVIDARDAPKDALSVPSGTLVELDSQDQQSARWSYNEIVESNKRAFLFRDVALELYFSDKRNFLVVFRDKKERQVVVQRLQYKNDARDAIAKSVIGNFVLDTMSRAMERSEQQLEAMTRRWQNREISNFAYLQLLNQYANRTPNDVTQYPVFPWVLSDYTSDVLDLDSDSSFRNLAFPMGALTPARREAAVERYSATEGVGEKPFHYGTHYTSSMIVCGFMIRVSPFTEIFLALQGGNFDLADRLFSSIPRAWDSASSDNRGDVRELIPEFYYSALFLLNFNHHDFGTKQLGDRVDHVELPSWAMGDPLLFVHRHREALESDYVSRHLPQWIDLTFGYKQRDPSSYTCFHPLSYRGAVDLENMAEDEKAASTAIIHNFGQTPSQIFKIAHPHRFLTGRSDLPLNVRFGVAEHWQLLMRSILPITESITPIEDITEPKSEEMKPAVMQRYRLIVPGYNMFSLQYGFSDGSIRVYHQEVQPRLITLVEGIYVERAVFASPTLLITVSKTSVLTAWRVSIKSSGVRRGDVTLNREATLRGHTSKVSCLAASSAWSFVVSGSEDGHAMIWDMNRLRYIRTLQTPRNERIKFAAVNEADGQIALATSRHIYLYTMNGHPIASTYVDADMIPAFRFGGPESAMEDPPAEYSGGISFLNREFLKFGVLFVIGIGSELALYRCMPGSKTFAGEDSKPWTLSEQGRLFRSEDHAGGNCTLVKFIGERLYAAFAPDQPGGKHLLYQWSLPEGQMRHVPEMVSHSCMAERCGRHFGLLEPKRYCGGCGGAFCGTHAVHVETFQHRYCEICRGQLSFASVTGILRNRKDSAVNSRRTSLEGSRRNSLSHQSHPFGAGGGSRPGSRRSSVIAGAGAGGHGSHTGSVSHTPHLPGSRIASGFATPLLGP